MSSRSVCVHQHAISGGALTAVIGNGLPVVEMRMLTEIELHVPPGIQPNMKMALRADPFYGAGAL